MTVKSRAWPRSPHVAVGRSGVSLSSAQGSPTECFHTFVTCRLLSEMYVHSCCEGDEEELAAKQVGHGLSNST